MRLSKSPEYNSEIMARFLAFQKITRNFCRGRASLLLISTFLPGISEWGIAQQTKPAAIYGVVNDASGNLIPDAVVRLRQAETIIATTRTDLHGSFAFATVGSGNYRVDAEKENKHASAMLSTRATTTSVVLTIVTSATGAENIDFADKPNFTVAGITDWTAVGGHGSDAVLRTSETLARATETLKQNKVVVLTQSDEKERALRDAVVASPLSFTANHELGRFYLQKTSYREAKPLLEAAYHIDPADRSNEYDLALAYKETGDLKNAHAHVNYLLASGDTADFHRLAGDVDEAQGDALSAEREYEAAVRLDPGELNEFTWGTELLLHRAIWPAIEVFRKGAIAYPKSARMRSAWGAALFASAQYEEAAQHLCEASDLNPKDSEPYIFLGEIEMTAPLPLACAESKLARFIQVQPEDSRAYYYYAEAILKRQDVSANLLDVERARLLLIRSIEINPKYGEAYLQLGILNANKKNFTEAIHYFTKAIEVEPQLADAYYRLGVAYQRIGAEEKAKREFDQHREVERAQAETVDQQRHKVKQFLVVLQGQPSNLN